MYKTRRQKRYEIEWYAGFVKFEARALSRIAFKVPYMLPLIKERDAEYDRAIKRAKRVGMPESEFNRKWRNFIKRRYIMKGWKRREERWGATVVFRMLKSKEFDYRRKYPDYTSPWEKRRKQFRDFIRRIEQEYEGKYPRGYGRKWAGREIRYKPEGGAELVEKE